MISIKETTDLKNELISKASERHKKAKSFKQFRKDARQKPLKKGEVRKLVNGKWVSNKKEEVEHIEEMASASNLKYGIPKGLPGLGGGGGGTNAITDKAQTKNYFAGLPGLGGGGGGTDAITAKAKTKSAGKLFKDLGNLAKRPFRTKADRLAADPTSRFATEEKSCGEGQYYCHDDEKCKPIPKGYKVGKGGMLVKEGNLHKWFSGSKSKDGKKGWVNVVTGGTCASDKPGEGTPKCVSSSKRASMSKSERLSASRRKKKADPGQQSKSGAAKPTYVRTDKPKKKQNE